MTLLVLFVIMACGSYAGFDALLRKKERSWRRYRFELPKLPEIKLPVKTVYQEWIAPKTARDQSTDIQKYEQPLVQYVEAQQYQAKHQAQQYQYQLAQAQQLLDIQKQMDEQSTVKWAQMQMYGLPREAKWDNPREPETRKSGGFGEYR